MKGAAGMMGGTKLDAMFGVAGGNPVTAAGGGIPSLEAIYAEIGFCETEFAIVRTIRASVINVAYINNTLLHNS